MDFEQQEMKWEASSVGSPHSLHDRSVSIGSAPESCSPGHHKLLRHQWKGSSNFNITFTNKELLAIFKELKVSSNTKLLLDRSLPRCWVSRRTLILGRLWRSSSAGIKPFALGLLSFFGSELSSRLMIELMKFNFRWKITAQAWR